MAGYLGGTLVYRNQIGVDHRQAEAGRWRERTLPATGAVLHGPAGTPVRTHHVYEAHGRLWLTVSD